MLWSPEPVLRTVKPEEPLNLYNRDPDIHTQDTNPLVWFQLRWRAPTYTSALTLADNAYKALHTTSPDWGGTGLNPLWVTRDITATPDQDSNGRWEKADSYQIRLNP